MSPKLFLLLACLISLHKIFDNRLGPEFVIHVGLALRLGETDEETGIDSDIGTRK
jgi:hypothetical protein